MPFFTQKSQKSLNLPDAFFTQNPQKCKAFNEVKSLNLLDALFHAAVPY